MTLTDAETTIPIKVRLAHSNEPCRFLSCNECLPHDHPICPMCGSVKFSNLSCALCRLVRP
jgi:hypothetical protein